MTQEDGASAITLYQERIPVLKDKLSVAEKQFKEAEAAYPTAGVPAIASGIVAAIAGPFLFVLPGLGVTGHIIAIGVTATAGMGSLIYGIRQDIKARRKMESLGEEVSDLREQKNQATTRQREEAEAAIDRAVAERDHLSSGEQLPFTSQDGTPKIVEIESFQRGTSLDQQRQRISVKTVTATLYEAGPDETTGAFVRGLPSPDVHKLERIYREELQM